MRLSATRHELLRQRPGSYTNGDGPPRWHVHGGPLRGLVLSGSGHDRCEHQRAGQLYGNLYNERALPEHRHPAHHHQRSARGDLPRQPVGVRAFAPRSTFRPLGPRLWARVFTGTGVTGTSYTAAA
ncbi:MAG: hypothetical protein H6577_16415 [Lewinellaceae bacterium]|nr:hypothetical protein [Lewinellaceae bacterium]